MSELSFEQMLEESFKTIRTGEVVEGTVIGVKEDEIILTLDTSQTVSLPEANIRMIPVLDLSKLVPSATRWKQKF